MELTGIHHLTAITADARGNHRFYTQALGLRLVKKTVNQDDVSAYHLFYADGLASPGTDITFFDWPVGRERRGTHAITRTGLRVPGGSLAFWRERFRALGVTSAEIIERDGRQTLDFEDPEGQRLSLVSQEAAGPTHPWARSPVPGEHQILGLGPIRISVPDLKPTDLVLTQLMGMRPLREYQDGATVVALRDGRGRARRGAARRRRAWAAAGPARRRRRPSRRVPHSGRRLCRLGGSPQAGPCSFERSGRPLLVQEPLLPGAERHIVRDRDGRSGICDRRAGGAARGEPVLAPIPRGAPLRDRGEPEAAG